MKNKTHHYQHLMKKIKFFFQVLHFVLKKIISLHPSFKSSVLLHSCLWNLRSFKRYNKSINPAEMRIYLLLYQVFLRTSKAESKSANFILKKVVRLQII